MKKKTEKAIKVATTIAGTAASAVTAAALGFIVYDGAQRSINDRIEDYDRKHHCEARKPHWYSFNKKDWNTRTNEWFD